MKSQIVWKWSLGMCLTVLPFAGGCLQGASNSAVTNTVQSASVTTNNPPPQAEEAEDAAAMAAALTNAPAIDISEAAIKPVTEETPLPATIRSVGPAGDLFKLAASGVDEEVILSYITNSTSSFKLNADEIIYLKDLGLSGTVIAATLHKDHALKDTGAAQDWQANPAQAYGGTTTNWIGAAQQPAPEQVAPQAIAPQQADMTQAQPVPAAPQTEVTYSTFYDSLSPYGVWLDVDGYGRVWQPRAVVLDPGWRPYFDGGRWVYSDHGWYWSSDYSWGWAPFHYGRWFHHRRAGWCWTPDYVWGPSWVSWRYDDNYCGWAPLPPSAYYRPGLGFTYYGASVGFSFGFGLGYDSFCFVGWNRFHDRHHHGHALPPHHAHEVFSRTKPVTRIVDSRNRISNEGIPARRVAAATHKEVRPVALREVRGDIPRNGRGERFDPASRTMTVYKPAVTRTERGGGTPAERVRTGTAASRTDISRAPASTGSPAAATARSRTSRDSGTPATTPSTVQRAAPAQPRINAAQSPSSVTRQPAARPSTPNTVQAPSTPAPGLRQPSVAPSRQSTTPSVTTPRSSASPAPTQRQSSTSQAVPRAYNAPAPVQRQSSPQTTSRSYSAPAQVQRQYTAPQTTTRTYSAPAASAPASRQYSAPKESQQSSTSSRSFTAPRAAERSMSPPAASSSRGGGAASSSSSRGSGGSSEGTRSRTQR